MALYSLLLCTLLPVTDCTAQPAFRAVPDVVSATVQPAIIGDFNGDGWWEALGSLNNGAGTLNPLAFSVMQLRMLVSPGSAAGYPLNDARLADFNGDGIVDLITQDYGSTSNTALQARLFINSGLGQFIEDPAFARLSIRGRGEGLVVADFNNDGAVDIFLPFYTYPCSVGDPDPKCPNSPQSYLLINDGNGQFTDVADAAGLAMRAPVGLAVPPNTQPEGGHAADLNDDGRIDLYIAGKVFLNQGINPYTVPGSNRNLLLPVFTACACGIPGTVGDGTRADEGAKFLDWNNDGRLDLLLHDWNKGPVLLENDGDVPKSSLPAAALQVHFSQRVWTTDSPSRCATAGSGDPACKRLFALASAPNAAVPFQDSFGTNSFDLDNDGLEDIFSAASVDPPISQCPPGSGIPCPIYPQRVFLNNGNGFVHVDAGALSSPKLTSTVTFADLDNDKRIDVVDTLNATAFINTAAVGSNSAFTLEVLDAKGARNQYGRTVRILLPKAGCTVGQTGCTLTRVVDGGSGYHSQGQYPLLIGTPYAAAHRASVVFPYASTLVEVAFDIFPGQKAKVYAPSPAAPNGRYVIVADPQSATPTPTPTPTASGCAKQPLNLSGAYPDGGFGYVMETHFGIAADTGTNPTQSTLQLFEDTRPLGPAHTLHATIRSSGQGRYSHWNSGSTEVLVFSASDNSDPRSNGHGYFYCLGNGAVQPTPPPLPTPTPMATPAPVATNVPPAVNLKLPAANASYTSGTAILLGAEATDSDGTVARVEFYDHATLLGSASSAPYRLSWTDAGLGSHSLIAKAVDNNGAATTSLSLNVNVVASSGRGLQAEYYNSNNLTGPVSLQRTEAVNFNWGTSAPGGGVPGDNFSVRWTGSVQATITGGYQFQTNSDDGVRLWVNKRLLIDNWSAHPSTLNTSARVNLVAGQRVTIKLEYHENSGGALMQLNWKVPGRALFRPIPPAQLYRPGPRRISKPLPGDR